MKILKNRTVLGVICIIISVIVCFVITPLFNKGLSEKVDIVIAKKNVEKGEQINEDAIGTVSVLKYNLPKNIVYKKEEVLNKYAIADIFVGDYILESKISETPSKDNEYLYNLDGNKQAISITINGFAKGLSGKLKAGDIVSVIKVTDVPEIPKELKYVEIIGVSTASGREANTDEKMEMEGEEELPDTVTLLVTEEQSKILAGIESTGNAHLTLVYRGTKSEAMKFIKLQEKILTTNKNTEETNKNAEEIKDVN